MASNSRMGSMEIDFLVLRFLRESGYDEVASLFELQREIRKYGIEESRVSSGALLSFVERGIEAISEGHRGSKHRDVSHPQIPDRDKELLESHRYLLNHSSKRTDTAWSLERRAVTNTEVQLKVQKISQKRTTSEDLLTFIVDEPEVRICAWNPSLPILATATSNPDGRLWQISTEQSGSNDSHLVISGEPTILEDGKEIKNPISALEWNPQGNILSVGTNAGEVKLFAHTGRFMQEYKVHEAPIFALKWNRRGSFLLSGSIDCKTATWDIRTRAFTRQDPHHNEGILDLDWLDEKTFASCAADNRIYLWSINHLSPVKQFLGHANDVNCIKFHPTKKVLASCSDDKTAKIWSTETTRLMQNLNEHKAEVSQLRWSPLGSQENILATASYDYTVKIWDVLWASCKQTFKSHTSAVYVLEYSPDGQFLASGSNDGTLIIWNAKDGEALRKIKGNGRICTIAWSEDGMKFVAGYSDNTACVLDVRKIVSHSEMMKP